MSQIADYYNAKMVIDRAGMWLDAPAEYPALSGGKKRRLFCWFRHGIAGMSRD